MRQFVRLCPQLGLLLALALATPAPVSARTWTNTEDQTLEADFVRYRSSDRTVLLRDEEGKLVPAPLDRLSEEDRQWIEDYRGFVAPRIWGDPAKRQRGRFQLLRDDHIEVRLASETLTIPFNELTAEDVEHLEALHQHTEKELPAGFYAVKRAAVASQPPEDAIEREWTDAKGRSLTALYGGTQGERAILWINDKRFEYPLSRLSAVDRAWIAQAKLGQLASDLQGGWSAAATIATTGMAKAMMEGRTPPVLPPLGPPVMGPPVDRSARFGDPSQMAADQYGQPPQDGSYQDPMASADPSMDPNAAVQGYQAADPTIGAPAVDGTQPVDPNATAPTDPSAGGADRGDPPWITSSDELSADEYDSRLNEAFAAYPDIDYDDPHADAYCSHCAGEYVVPVGFNAGAPCPLCGVPLAEGDISLLSGDDESDSSGRPWYMSRFMRRLVIGAVVLIIGVAIQLARSGIFSGGDGGGEDEDDDA